MFSFAKEVIFCPGFCVLLIVLCLKECLLALQIHLGTRQRSSEDPQHRKMWPCQDDPTRSASLPRDPGQSAARVTTQSPLDHGTAPIGFRNHLGYRKTVLN